MNTGLNNENTSMRTSFWQFYGLSPSHVLLSHCAALCTVSCSYTQIPSFSLPFSIPDRFLQQQSSHILMVQQVHQALLSALTNYFPILHLQAQPGSLHHYLTSIHLTQAQTHHQSQNHDNRLPPYIHNQIPSH